ncbi:MAG: alanine racemase [Pseudomonadota bacterium]
MIPPEPPPPTLRLSVDTQALADNWRALDRLSGSASAGAAVKAQCYGLGVDTCVPRLRDAGCTRFFVAHWSEVAAVAQHVPTSSIAVLHGAINAAEIAYARASGAVPVINSTEQAQAWSESGGGACHLMVDTGINRLGVGMEELSSDTVQGLEVDILMSHLACADEDSGRNHAQLEQFRSAVQRVPHRQASLANSAGIALGSEYAFDVTRPGLALYGGVPRSELGSHIKPVASIQAAVLQVRDVQAGDAIGYNGEFVAQGNMRIATVSLGYADGFLRSRGKDGVVIVDGDHCRILGKVSMDMIVIDLANAPDLATGDWVNVPFDLPHAAQQSSVSQYELLTMLGGRLRP